jgi:hypothetical protein
MPFRPNVNDQLTINGVTYRVAEHPAAPGFPYGQEGRAGIVYQLLPSPTGRAAGGEGVKPPSRSSNPASAPPALLTQAQRLAPFAALPGLAACQRTVLSPTHHPDLLRQHPDLTYAALMPWIAGPTWLDVLLAKQPLPAQQALTLARSLAEALEAMELRGIAHCDLSAANLILPLLAGGSGIALVDLGRPVRPRPQPAPDPLQRLSRLRPRPGRRRPVGPGGRPLRRRSATGGDAGLVRPRGRAGRLGGELLRPGGDAAADSRATSTLVAALERRWGSNVARLFERAWRSESLLDCPTFGEWLLALPEHPAVGQGQGLPLPVAPPGPREEERSTAPAAVEATAEIRAFMQAARRMEDKGDLDSALKLYRQALELAQADPSLRSLAREVELTVQDVQARARPISPRIEEGLGERAISLPGEEVRVALPAEEGPGIREEPRPSKRPWGWVLGGLVVFALLAALVYGVNVQQQQAAQATATAQAQATATAQAQATVQAQATANAQAAQATATAIAWQQATATAQAQATATARAQAGRIAFASNRDGNWEIYVMNADGSGQINLTNNPADDGVPSWSPDGRRIAFVSNRDGNLEIYVMNADGSSGQINRLTNNPADDVVPSWSPDGRRIAFDSKTAMAT